MVATTGFIAAPRPVTAEDQRMAEALLFSVAGRAASFIGMARQRPFEMQPQRDVRALRDALKVVITDTTWTESLASMMALDPVVAADYREEFEVARETALGAYPLTEIPTMAGPVEVDPPDDLQQEWLSIVAVLENVERMLDELEMYALTVIQVEKFKMVYPELHAFMASVFDEEMANRRALEPEWVLPEDKETSLRIFKAMVAEEPIRPLPPPLPKGKPGDGDEAKESVLSVGQKALYR